VQFELSVYVSTSGAVRDRRVTTEEKIMTHSAMQETIEFASRMGPVKQLDIEKHLKTDCKSVARVELLKRIVLHVKRVHFSKQNVPSLLLLLVELAITLVVAGIVIPSFLRSGVEAKEALVRGSLHSINIAGIAFSFTYQSLGWALLGMLSGAVAAFLLAYPVSRGNSKEHLTSTRCFFRKSPHSVALLTSPGRAK
jgi:hypothetical protein